MQSPYPLGMTFLMAEALCHSSARARMLRRTANLEDDDCTPGWPLERFRRKRAKARRLLRELYGEDTSGWDGA